MKSILVFICTIVLVFGQSIDVLKQDLEVNSDGSYKHGYELSNGQAAQEVGVGGERVQGSFRWISPEGEKITMLYTADENGYQPQGSSIPQPPPIPPLILKALQYLRATLQKK